MLKGFKEFIMKGNVLDLAVAVIIGAAFSRIITALVDNILMPAISALVGSPNFDSFGVLTVRGNDLQFGVLLTAIVNFLLVAAAVYFAIVAWTSAFVPPLFTTSRVVPTQPQYSPSFFSRV